MVAFLLEKRAEPNAPANDGFATIHWAAQNNGLDVGKLLLKARAEVNAQDDEGQTALHLAADFGSLEVAKLLVNARADLNLKMTYSGKDWTPLDRAQLFNQGAVAQLLKDADDGKYFENKEESQEDTPDDASADGDTVAALRTELKKQQAEIKELREKLDAVLGAAAGR